MNRDGLGLVGGIAADRPIISTLVLAFGLTALAVIGAEQAFALRGAIVDFLGVGGAVVGLPLAVAAMTPDRAWGRVGLSVAVAALGAALLMAAPPTWMDFALVSAGPISVGVALAVLVMIALPAFGALSRLAYLPAAATLLGCAGAFGFFSLRGHADAALYGPWAGLALAMGLASGLGVLSEFATEFARGADRRSAAGRAAQEGVGSAAFAAIMAASAFGLLQGRTAGEGLAAAELAGVAALLASASALSMSAAALSLRRASEAMAVEENRRRQAFRAWWRPVRRALSPAAANAAVAIAAIAVMAIALNMTAPVSLALVVFIVVAGAFSGIILFSLRAGLFVFFSLLVSVVVVKWLWIGAGLPNLSPTDEAAALALAALLFGQLGLAWREARSPRLNSRETTEAAMANAFRLYAASALVGMAAFFAMGPAGLWATGPLAAAEAGMLLTVGLLLGPALMTALSNAVRRELA